MSLHGCANMGLFDSIFKTGSSNGALKKQEITTQQNQNKLWTPMNPRLSAHRPLSALEHIFIFTDSDGSKTLNSRAVVGVTQDTAEALIENIMGKIPIDVIARSNAYEVILLTQQLPETVWTAMSGIDPVLAKKAKSGAYRTCIRPIQDPMTKESVAILLIYRD